MRSWHPWAIKRHQFRRDMERKRRAAEKMRPMIEAMTDVQMAVYRSYAPSPWLGVAIAIVGPIGLAVLWLALSR